MIVITKIEYQIFDTDKAKISKLEPQQTVRELTPVSDLDEIEYRTESINGIELHRPIPPVAEYIWKNLSGSVRRFPAHGEYGEYLREVIVVGCTKEVADIVVKWMPSYVLKDQHKLERKIAKQKRIINELNSEIRRLQFFENDWVRINTLPFYKAYWYVTCNLWRRIRKKIANLRRSNDTNPSDAE